MNSQTEWVKECFSWLYYTIYPSRYKILDCMVLNIADKNPVSGDLRRLQGWFLAIGISSVIVHSFLIICTKVIIGYTKCTAKKEISLVDCGESLSKFPFPCQIRRMKFVLFFLQKCWWCLCYIERDWKKIYCVGYMPNNLFLKHRHWPKQRRVRPCTSLQ